MLERMILNANEKRSFGKINDNEVIIISLLTIQALKLKSPLERLLSILKAKIETKTLKV